MNMPISRRKFFGTMAAGTALVGLYTWRVEPFWVDYVQRTLPVMHLPDALRGKTLVQLSDLHVGAEVDDAYLRKVFSRVSALAPDIVVYTGDFMTYAGRQTLAQLANLVPDFARGKLGTFAVLGNHDYGDNWNDSVLAGDAADVLESNGCLVLRNQSASVEGMTIVGLDDLWATRCKPESIMGTIRSGEPALVLSHNPDSCDLPGWADYSGWILCGHTHGGQCKAPFFSPPINPVRNKRYVAGELALSGGRYLYINRGVGHLGHVRFNARPEVTIFTLARAGVSRIGASAESA